jgi:hypothetical protein
MKSNSDCVQNCTPTCISLAESFVIFPDYLQYYFKDTLNSFQLCFNPSFIANLLYFIIHIDPHYNPTTPQPAANHNHSLGTFIVELDGVRPPPVMEVPQGLACTPFTPV